MAVGWRANLTGFGSHPFPVFRARYGTGRRSAAQVLAAAWDRTGFRRRTSR